MLRWYAAACFISRLRFGFRFSSLVVVARAGHLHMLTLTYVLDRTFEVRGPSVLPNKNLINLYLPRTTVASSTSYDIASSLWFVDGDIVVVGCWVRVVSVGGTVCAEAGYEPSRILDRRVILHPFDTSFVPSVSSLNLGLSR